MERVDNITYDDFLKNYLQVNKPCIFSKNVTNAWICRELWITPNNKPNFQQLRKCFGQSSVPVANCNEREYNSQCKEQMMLSEYLDYWENLNTNEDNCNSKCLYLKDWHFQKEYPSQNAYVTPIYFSCDWLNEFCKAEEEDDYRFVYMGPKGSWTPLHADVFGSYSWSANICGRKKWIMFEKGVEKSLINQNKKMPYSIEEIPDKLSLGTEVIQEAGEIIFIPSGWYHQVWNLEDCISINHNWFNSCNIQYIWNQLQKEAKLVEKELSDFMDSEDWVEQCQLVLKAHHGMNYDYFIKLLKYISESCIQNLSTDTLVSNKYLLFDISQIQKVLVAIVSSSNVPPIVTHEIRAVLDNIEKFGQQKNISYL